MAFTVYKHTTPSNKVYIGITSQEVGRRWQCGSGYYGNDHFRKAIKKYGWENITHEVLYTGLTKEQACSKEIELIAEYDSANPEKGYNKSTGGEHARVGSHHSEETKRRYSEIRKGRIHSEETKAKMSKAHTGKKYRKRQEGRVQTQETRDKISRANSGKKRDEDTVRKLRQISKHKKAVECIETGLTYESIADAERNTGIHNQCIRYACKGKRKTAGGYTWKFIE